MSKTYNLRSVDKIFVLVISTVLMYFFCTWFFPMAFQHMVDGLRNWHVN